MPDKGEIQQVVDALWEVYRIRDEPIGNTEVARRIKQVAKDLAASDTNGTKYGGIRKNVADAIAKSYLKAPLDRL